MVDNVQAMRLIQDPQILRHTTKISTLNSEPSTMPLKLELFVNFAEIQCQKHPDLVVARGLVVDNVEGVRVGGQILPVRPHCRSAYKHVNFYQLFYYFRGRLFLLFTGLLLFLGPTYRHTIPPACTPPKQSGHPLGFQHTRVEGVEKKESGLVGRSSPSVRNAVLPADIYH